MTFGAVSLGTPRREHILETKSFDAAAQTYDFTYSLAPLTSGILVITGRWVVGALTAGTAVLTLRINGANAAYSAVQEGVAVGTTSSSNTTGVPIAQGKDTVATYNPIDVERVVLRSLSTSLQRSITAIVYDHSAVTTYPRIRESRQTVSTPATGVAITSIGIGCDTANGIGIGSWFRLTWEPA